MTSAEAPQAAGGETGRVRPQGAGFSSALRAISLSEAVTVESPPGGQSPLVCPIRHRGDLEEVYRLTHDAYVLRGYCHPQPGGRLVHYPQLDEIPETTVLVAIQDGVVVGTNSLTLDGPRGLHVDHDFKAECDRIRGEGRRLGASWRIVTREDLHSETKIVMLLIRETVHLALAQGVETMVFTFNPRHERIYKKLLNMETVARKDCSVDALVNAPAVFMLVRDQDLPARWLEAPEREEIRRRRSLRECAAQRQAAVCATAE